MKLLAAFAAILFHVALFNIAAAETTQYTLASGDKIKITVFGQKDLSGEFEVNGDGKISMPLIGEVELNGLTLNQAERNIIKLLKDGYLKRPKVSVEVENYRPFYIIGEVNKPGNYPYVNGMTALNAVAIAEGFTYRANEKKLVIIRAADPERKEQILPPTTIILPGDFINVKERFF